MKRVYIVHPEGGYGERQKTRNRLKASWYLFALGVREFFTPGPIRRIVVSFRLTNDY